MSQDSSQPRHSKNCCHMNRACCQSEAGYVWGEAFGPGHKIRHSCTGSQVERPCFSVQCLRIVA